jgi:hypothetical protein
VIKMIEFGSQIRGGNASAVRRAVRARFPGLRDCFELGVETDGVERAAAFMNFELRASGEVAQRSISIDGDMPEPMRTCIREVVADLRLTEPPGVTVSVAYPIDFVFDD